MTMILTGDYSNIRRFIHELETAPEFLVLESVAVAGRVPRATVGSTSLRRWRPITGAGAWQLSRAGLEASEPGAAGAARVLTIVALW